jgi:hypothetical protein
VNGVCTTISSNLKIGDFRYNWTARKKFDPNEKHEIFRRKLKRTTSIHFPETKKSDDLGHLFGTHLHDCGV